MPSIPATALWRHLGYTPSLPWSLGLRVEVDGALEEQRHQAVLRVYEKSGGSAVTCAPAFRPLAGKQHVAWRFMRPDTLVYAVRTPGCSAEATERGEEEEGAAPLVSSISRQPRRQVPATHTPSAPNRAAAHTLSPTPAGLEDASGGQARKRQRLQVGGWLASWLGEEGCQHLQVGGWLVGWLAGWVSVCVWGGGRFREGGGMLAM